MGRQERLPGGWGGHRTKRDTTQSCLVCLVRWVARGPPWELLDFSWVLVAPGPFSFSGLFFLEFSAFFAILGAIFGTKNGPVFGPFFGLSLLKLIGRPKKGPRNWSQKRAPKIGRKTQKMQHKTMPGIDLQKGTKTEEKAKVAVGAGCLLSSALHP